MPLSQYYGGKGESVMRGMEKTYPDDKTAKRVFYATLNKRKSEGHPIKGRQPGQGRRRPADVLRGLQKGY